MSLPLISQSDIVSNNELTVILEIIVQCDVTSLISLSDIVSINELTVILEIIVQCDVTQIMSLSIKTIASVLNVLT